MPGKKAVPAKAKPVAAPEEKVITVPIVTGYVMIRRLGGSTIANLAVVHAFTEGDVYREIAKRERTDERLARRFWSVFDTFDVASDRRALKEHVRMLIEPA